MVSYWAIFFSEFFFLICSFERAQAVRGAEGEGEAESLLSRESNTGLDPWTLGSQPEPKAELH